MCLAWAQVRVYVGPGPRPCLTRPWAVVMCQLLGSRLTGSGVALATSPGPEIWGGQDRPPCWGPPAVGPRGSSSAALSLVSGLLELG